MSLQRAHSLANTVHDKKVRDIVIAAINYRENHELPDATEASKSLRKETKFALMIAVDALTS